MTKTIEEAAKSIAKDFIMEHKSRINNDAPLTHECVQYAIERIFSLPLASRLTAEEKERVRKEYGELLSYAAIYKKKLSNSVDAVGTQLQSQNYQFYVAQINQIKLLERIFGDDFFKEGE